MGTYDFDPRGGLKEKQYIIGLDGREYILTESVLTAKISEVRSAGIPPNIERKVEARFTIRVVQEDERGVPVASRTLDKKKFIDGTDYFIISYLAKSGAFSTFEKPSTVVPR